MDDFWLNEGFTVWAERRILENLDGPGGQVAWPAAIGRNGLMEAMNSFGMDSPFTQLETDGSGTDPDEFYSLVPYEKGFLFVALLEQAVGPREVRRLRQEVHQALQLHLDHHRPVRGVPERRTAGRGRADRCRTSGSTRPGLPDNAPVFASARLDMLEDLAKGWSDGGRPDVAEAKEWSPEDWQIFLQALPAHAAGRGLRLAGRELRPDRAGQQRDPLQLAGHRRRQRLRTGLRPDRELPGRGGPDEVPQAPVHGAVRRREDQGAGARRSSPPTRTATIPSPGAGSKGSWPVSSRRGGSARAGLSR